MKSMDYKNQAWFSEFNLNEEAFSSLPQGKNPILWALQNNIVDPQNYMNWASEHHQVPRIDDSFFNFSMDSSLKDKYQNLYAWNASCYPIYEWEGTLFVACLEPIQLDEQQKVCFVIASYSAMDTAWNKNYGALASSPETLTSVTQAPQQSINDEMTDGFEFKKSQTEVSATESENVIIAPAANVDLDFSNLNLGASDDATIQENEIIEPPKEAPQIKVVPKDKSDNDALDGLSFADLNLSNDDSSKNDQIEAFDDDITPPPLEEPITMGKKISPTADIDEHTQSMGHEVTETDDSAPIYIPSEKRITDEDLKKHTDLNYCQGTKEIISHIFHHLKKDFNKLMWIELSETGQFFPRFVYGPWKIDSTAWNHAIDVSKPNIFRIAFKSSLPFHGEVSDNKINSSYFSWWNNGMIPNQVTVFPLIFDEACFGFITCFDKGSSFNTIDSLKKIENLISLSNKAFQAVHQKKAS